MASFTALQHYWRCGRRWAWYAQGWQLRDKPEPLQVGSLVHKMLAEHYRTQKGPDAVLAEAWHAEAEEPGKVAAIIQRASKLFQGYMDIRSGVYEPLIFEGVPLVEATFLQTAPGKTLVKGVIDLVATIQPDGILAVVDFKTGTRTNMDWLRHSRQLELYAYLLHLNGVKPDLAVYEIINDDMIVSFPFKPDLDRGCWLAGKIINLARISCESCLDEPHFLYDCPYCPYFRPCHVLENGGDPEVILEQLYTRVGIAGESDNLETGTGEETHDS